MSVGMPEGKRQLGRPRHKWDDDSEMILEGTCTSDGLF
jgi:hypothetical protein